MDALQGCVLNYTVLDSLILTIFVSLVVMHAGGNAYAVTTSDVAQRLGSDPIGDHRAWADLATFLSPMDVPTQEAIRRVVYILEYISLAIGTLLCTTGLWETLFSTRRSPLGSLLWSASASSSYRIQRDSPSSSTPSAWLSSSSFLPTLRRRALLGYRLFRFLRRGHPVVDL